MKKTALVLASIFATSLARAEPPAPESKTFTYSAYEQQSIDDELRSRRFELEPSPEGKVVESVEISRLDVIEERDPAPRFLNVFHWETRDYVVRREMLFSPGDRYAKVVVDETARNLRGLGKFSVVLVLAVRGSTPDRVRVLVITKDVWSLRLAWDAQVTSGGIESLTIEPQEANLLGTHQSLSLPFSLDPASVSGGARYVVPRILGSRVAATGEAGIRFNRESGSAEGSYGSLSVGQPLWSTRTEWAWALTAKYDRGIARRFVNARQGFFAIASTPEGGAVPYRWRSSTASYLADVTRSFGWAQKVDVTVGAEASLGSYRTDDLSAYDPATVAAFRKYVPTSDDLVAPFVQVRSYSTSYLRVLDFESLALQEDFRLGQDVFARIVPSTTALGSSRSYVGLRGGAQYTVPMGDGLARVATIARADQASHETPDASIEGDLRLVTPRLGFGRLVFDATALNRFHNYLRQTSFLGGEGRLRGYPTSFFVGKDLVAANLEYRSRPLRIYTVSVGGALFFDTGDAFDGFRHLDPHQSVGLGTRVLFPQLDHTVFRIDVGFPIAPNGLPPGVSPVGFYAAFEQAFAVPSAAPTL